MNVPSVSSRRAFTLIELLVVISILAILMTLLFPAVSKVFDTAKKTQAKNDATQLATAVTAYYTEYGKMPLAESNDDDINKDAALVKVLSGQDEQQNPRKIVFLEIPNAKAGKNGAVSQGGAYTGPFMDSWGKPYAVYVDGNYDNSITVPDGVGVIRKTVAVYSKGNPSNKKDYTDPSKFIKSWE